MLAGTGHYHYKEVVIHCLKRRKEEHLLEKLVLTAIYVHESGKKGTEWFLLSTVKIKGEKDVKKLIECYAHVRAVERLVLVV